MAMAASPVEDKSQSNSDAVTLPQCCICCTDFDAASHRPKVIPCGHTFCKTCLRILGTEFECPLCRQEISLSDQGMLELQTDFLTLQKSCRPKEPTEGNKCKHEEVEKEFSDTVNSINTKLKAIEKELFCSETIKTVVLESVDAHFDHLIHIANRRRQLLKNQIHDMHNESVETIEKQMEKFTLSLMCLDTLQKNLTHVLGSGNSENFLHNVSSEIAEITENLKDIDLGKNRVEFVCTDTDAKEITMLFRKHGRLRSQVYLPNAAILQEKKAVVSVPSHICMRVVDFRGMPVQDLDKPEKYLINFNIIDSNKREVAFDTWCTKDGVSLSFTPNVCGAYSVYTYFCGHMFEKTDFVVEKWKPIITCSYGSTTEQEDDLELDSPHAICSDTDGSTYITDTSLGFLVKLDKYGQTLWRKRIVDGHMKTLFDAEIHDNDMYCTSCRLEHADEFDQELQTTLQLVEGESDYLIDRFDKISANCIGYRKLAIHQTEQSAVGALYWYNIHGYLCQNKDDNLVLSDIDKHKLLLADREGNVSKTVTYEDFGVESPTFLCSGPDSNIYLSDIGAGNVKVLSGDLSLLLQEYSTHSEDPEKSLSPTGIVCVGKMVFVADSFGKNIYVINCENKKLVSYEVHGCNKLPSCPWNIAVSPDGYLWIIDRENGTISSYCLHVGQN